MKIALLLLLFVATSSFGREKAPVKLYADTTSQKLIGKKILKYLQSSDYDSVSTYFHAALKTALPVEKLAENWESINQHFGKFKEIISMKSGKVLEYHQLLIRCKFEKDNATMELNFNSDDRLAGLFIRP